ncbi:hypothetical protein GYM26_004626 [Escherichia coli]|uniref:Uncharacterized protein n=1 Tax=Enterobacter hormaechei TaxID=158836 RepID=A0A855VFX5_9ENTR|nr:hypothetical protein [Escherichia coli]EFI4057750.1 hypothetical protein [Escherichia coli]EFI6237126.1 hypothetical protein [Escherichia coli]PTX80940.1 hypothetical protein C1O12_25155 [Enterobacter hormaechei]HAS1420837.1 hypothetical protein [Enterobacter asburiae]
MLLCPPAVVIDVCILAFGCTITVIQHMNNAMQLKIAGYSGDIVANETRVALECIKVNAFLPVIKSIKNKCY